MYSELRVVLEPQATPAELLPELDNVLAVLGVDGVVLGDGDVRAPRQSTLGKGGFLSYRRDVRKGR